MAGLFNHGFVLADRLLDSFRDYIERLTTDQIEVYFLGLMGVGFVLGLYLLYSIHRRSQARKKSAAKPVEIATPSATGLAELLRSSERSHKVEQKKKHTSLSFLGP